MRIKEGRLFEPSDTVFLATQRCFLSNMVIITVLREIEML
jgi:hypothetical protein